MPQDSPLWSVSGIRTGCLQWILAEVLHGYFSRKNSLLYHRGGNGKASEGEGKGDTLTDPPQPPITRTVERRSFKRCMLQWQWAWRYGYRIKGKSSLPLWFGTGIHECLAQWYVGPGQKRGIHPADYWLDWVGEEVEQIRTAQSDNFKEDIWVDARDLGEAMLVGYIERYGRDESWDVVAPEETFQIDIPFRNKEGVLAIYAGTFDLVYRDLSDGSIWLGEHKTAKAISTSHLGLDDQAGSYWAIASRVLQSRGVLKKGDRIEGIMYNFLRKGFSDDRLENEKGQKLNKDGSVSKNQPSPLFLRHPVDRTKAEQASQLKRIQDEVSWMDIARRNPDRITKNSTQNCHWDCSFFDMCELHEKGGTQWEEFAKAVYVQQDPYADHRKSASD